ncbi:copper resistance protein CopC [Effusibacillus lacus]|uniref:CopC domain-containing protein n=1 Tax=Effusibacillus lacus TaxID=1348429 RepID=A0A292YTY5_9BACL|nr:copper resistance protein CopC [Effusibacillus lacus]TCS73550.1 copper transport protein [Effusibacillus lacus]GAX91955.1 hypothetical protein EFBL_3646 [Effusibacillus lacus]
MTRIGTWLVVLLLTLWVSTGTVSAHANLTGTDPKDGAVLDESPEQIVLDFNEFLEREAVDLEILDGNGVSVTPVEIRIARDNAKRMLTDVPPLKEGTYTVRWSVLSEDGHPVTDSFRFSVGKETSEAVPVSPIKNQLANSVEPILLVLRFLAESILLIAGGFLWFSCWAGKRGFPDLVSSLSKLRIAGLILLATITAAELLAYLTYLPNSISASLLRAGDWSALKQIPFAVVLVIQLGLLALLALPQMQKSWYLGLWAMLVASFAFSGHAWGVEPVWLALLFRILHLLALALWLGAMSWLVVALMRESRVNQPINRAALRPFFVKVVFAASAMTVLSGIVMTNIQTDWWILTAKAGLWSTLLLGKIGLVLAMLGLALRQTLQWRKNSRLLSPCLLQWEWIAGVLVLAAGVWLSQIKYPLP